MTGRRGDPLHPFDLAELYVARIPDCRLVEDTDPVPLDRRPDDLADLLVELAD